MARVILVRQVRKILKELIGGEHPLVDDHVGRQRADVKHLGLGQRLVASQLMAGSLADEIQLALEFVTRDSTSRGDHHLFDRGFTSERRRAQIGEGIVDRHLSPTDQLLAVLFDQSFDDFFAGRAFGVFLRQKNITRGEAARGRHIGS
jgi:hypothetical protein